MPYGAPDLLVAQRPQMTRALALSSLLATGLFLVLAQLVGLIPAEVQPIPKIPAIVRIDDVDILPDVVPPADARVQPRIRPFDANDGIPKAIRDELVKPSPARIDWKDIA